MKTDTAATEAVQVETEITKTQTWWLAELQWRRRDERDPRRGLASQD